MVNKRNKMIFYTENRKTCNENPKELCEHRCNITNENSVGYKCGCNKGHKLEKDGKSCTDINECLIQPPINSAGQMCVNYPGSYIYVCSSGTIWNGKHCQDLESYLANANANSSSSCVKYECWSNSSCYETQEKSRCDCVDNNDKNSTNQTCNFINMCNITDKEPCAAFHEACVLSVENYFCYCKTGYKLTNEISSCRDIDECAEKLHKCGSNAICLNTAGSYVCVCGKDYEGNGQFCVEKVPALPDEDWCAANNSCGENTVCSNSQMGALCSCTFNYFGNAYQSCAFYDPSTRWLLQMELSLPLEFRVDLKYKYSALYLNFTRDLMRILEPIFEEVVPNYIKDSISIGNIRYRIVSSSNDWPKSSFSF